MQHYVDDNHHVEPLRSAAQAWVLVKRTLELLGPRLATPGGPKFPLPRQCYRLLGAQTDLREGRDEIQILPARAQQLDADLAQIERNDLCGSGLAGEMHGKLNFANGQLFGRFGRRYLQAFCKRQYSRASSDRLDEGLRCSARFWRRALRLGPFRTVPPSPSTPLVISFSDGEGSGSVAAAIWSP